MSAPIQAEVRNRLLSLMSKQDFDLLAPHMSLAEMPRGFAIVEADRPIQTAVFPETAIGSIIVVSSHDRMAEGGLFGRDGFSPAELVLGVDRTPNRIVMQGAGQGWIMPAQALAGALEASATLRSLLARYIQTLSVQQTYTALSNAVHPVPERLARWLLMCHDRTAGNEMAVTHEFLSIMLAVRRPSVTTALHELEGAGFIRAERGSVIMRDRRGLIEFAADAYGRPEAEYERLVGPMS